jgi:hypothetical protein
MPDVLERPIEAESRLRAKNQVTVPEPILRALDAAPHDRLAWAADPAEPGVARVQVVPRDFAGSLTGVFGSAEEVLEFVRDEHDAWDE